MSKPQRYLILPARGLKATAENASEEARKFLVQLTTGRAVTLRTRLQKTATAGLNAARGVDKQSKSKTGKTTKKAAKKKAAKNDAGMGLTGAATKVPKAAFDVVSSLSEDGVKLVSATPEMMAAMRFDQPGLRVVPEIFYSPARALLRIRKKVTKKKSAATTALQRKLKISVVRSDTQEPVSGVDIIGFTNFEEREGVEGVTKASGKVTLTSFGSQKYERLYAQHEKAGLWSFLGKNVNADGTLTIALQALDLAVADSLRHFHDLGQDDDGNGVKVGVVDSGVALDHADLQVSGGLGCVPGEPESDFGPRGGSHGTHVAGIIAGRGNSPTGVRGMAPKAKIFSYRVFGNNDSSGSNFALVKAIQRGVVDGCDLLNMSLGFDPDENGVPQIDEAVQEAIREAHKKGVLVIAAAGNDGRRPVNYPALDDMVVAVSAVGRKGTFPAKSSESGDLLAPFGADPKNCVAAFSNIGTELDVTGAGVGVVSTVPDGYAPMSGTSMACPAVTGVLARLLAKAPTVLNMPRDSNRTDAIKALLFSHAKTLGFELKFEGKGLPK
jgi:subtilisin